MRSCAWEEDELELKATDVIVVGAGVCGLTVAHRLQMAGLSVTVLDKASYTGGRTKTHSVNNYTFNVGAAIFPSSYIETYELVVELGLESQILDVVPKTALCLEDCYHIFDMERPLASFIKAPYMGWKSKLSLVRLLPSLIKYWNKLPFHDLSVAAELDGESAESFCKNRITQEAYDHVINPLLRAIFAVNGNQISAAELLWILRHFSNCKMHSFVDGMQTLALTLGQQLDIRHGVLVKEVKEGSDGVTCHIETKKGPEVIESKYCVLATDGKDLLDIYGASLTQRQTQYLQNVQYFPLKMIIFMTTEEPDLDVFCLQIPEWIDKELCILVLEHKFSPKVAPPGRGVISFLGMSDWQYRMQDANDEQCIEDAKARMTRFLPSLEGKVEAVHLEHWPRGSTLGRTGIFRELKTFNEDINPQSRVLYTGDFMSSSSVNTAVSTANALSKRIL